MTLEIMQGRGCGPKKDHVLLQLHHLRMPTLLVDHHRGTGTKIFLVPRTCSQLSNRFTIELS